MRAAAGGSPDSAGSGSLLARAWAKLRGREFAKLRGCWPAPPLSPAGRAGVRHAKSFREFLRLLVNSYRPFARQSCRVCAESGDPPAAARKLGLQAPPNHADVTNSARRKQSQSVARSPASVRWCRNFGSHEKVCHFVDGAFLCLQGVTREITLHGVSLNFAQFDSPVPSGGTDRIATIRQGNRSGRATIASKETLVGAQTGASVPRKTTKLSKSNTALVERAGAHGASDLPDSTDLPSAIDLPGSTCRGHWEPCSRGLGSPVQVGTGSPVIGAKNCPDSG